MFSHRQFIALSLSLITVVSAAIAVPLPSRAATPLVVLPTSAHGWRPTPVSVGAARSDVIRRLPRADRPLVRRAGVQVIGARRGRAILRDEAFTLSSPGAAARIARAWAGRRSRRVAVGRGGHIVIGRGVAGVIWREGARVGLLILRQRASAGALRTAAVADARFADAALRAREPSDSWQRVLTGIDARGRVSRDTALAAFSLAYGPLPGVPTPGGHHAPIPSGTLAALWALAYAPRLSPAQRAVIDRRLGVRTGAARAAAAPGSGGDPQFTPNPYYQAVARNWQATYEQHLARPLGLQLVVGTSPGPGTAFADALPLNAQGEPEPGSGPPTSCRIRMGPLGEVSSSSFQLLVLAHEVFHCFQFALKGRNAWQFTAPWILEGMADWAALTVDPVPFEPVNAGGGGGNIKWYLETPNKELFTRSYDAVGFWGHVADFTGPLWPRVSAILNATSDVAAFKAAEGAEDNVLSSWGSSAFRVSPIAGFAMHSPIEPPHFDQLQPEGLKAVWADRVGAPAYTTSQYQILPLPHVPLIHVAIDGPSRLLTGGTEYRDLQDVWFCVQGEDCRCPPDSAGSVPPTHPLIQPAYLGLTGDPDVGTAGVVESETLAQFCRPKGRPPGPRPRPRPAPPGPLGCAAGCGSSNGDPHMHPFTADPYEFQAAGEFTLVRSNTGALEIQTREQPWGHTRDLSVNTAIAMRVGRATVELDAGRSMRLIVDDRRRPLPAGRLALRGGGALRMLAPLQPGSGKAAELVWPDGSRARVWPIEDFGLAILVAPARSLSGKLAGLLGNLGGSPSAPFVGRDGRQYPADLITSDGPASAAARYGLFGESWRVRQHGSLFTYRRGTNANSYTVRGFPFDQYDLSGAPAAQRAQAEQLCRSAGVSDPAALADCVVDVLGTGDRRFATSSVALQRSAGRGTLRAVHPWTKLSSVDDSATDVRPSLAANGSGITAAYRRDVDGAVELADLAPGVDGIRLRARTVPLNGWTSIADPVVFRSSGGQTGLLVAGLHSDDSSDPLNGTNVFARSDPGAGLGAPTSVSGAIADGLGAGAVLAADGVTPLWSSTTSGQLAVHHGDDEIDLPSPGLAVSSALAYDRAGDLWLAWHAVGAGAADGIYMLQLDAATGAPVTGATPQRAPASDSGNVQPLLPLACAARCRVVYVDARGQGTLTLDSWSPGDAAPTAIAHASGLRTPSAAYTAGGRLWVTWVSGDGNRLFAKLGDDRGAGGSAQLIPLPPSHDIPDTTTAIASGERLVLASEFSALSADVNSVWATVVDPR